MEAMAFVNLVAKAAERKGHHPDIDIRWNKVTLCFTTHSKGCLTEIDFTMARLTGDIFSRRRGAK